MPAVKKLGLGEQTQRQAIRTLQVDVGIVGHRRVAPGLAWELAQRLPEGFLNPILRLS